MEEAEEEAAAVPGAIKVEADAAAESEEDATVPEPEEPSTKDCVWPSVTTCLTAARKEQQIKCG